MINLVYDLIIVNRSEIMTSTHDFPLRRDNLMELKKNSWAG